MSANDACHFRPRSDNWKDRVLAFDRLCALPLLVFALGAAQAADIVVDTGLNRVDFAGNQQAGDLPGPDGLVSLHEAMTAANNTPGPDTITFDRDAGRDIEIRDPLPPLEDVSGGTTIQGVPGFQTLIENEFGELGDRSRAFHILSASNVIEGLTIDGFDTGVHLDGPGAVNNAIRSCVIRDRFEPITSSVGIYLSNGASENILGGFSVDEPGSTNENRNRIEDMVGVGILIEGEGTSFNHIFSNTIDGGTRASRTDVAIDIYGGANGNIIGGEVGTHNRIHGCDICGIRIFASNSNPILGNEFGFTGNGNAAGICIQSSVGFVIGSVMGGGNTIEDSGTAIRLISCAAATIEGNSLARNGGNGIEIVQSSSIRIGGVDFGAGNVIEDNGGNGILLDSNTLQVGILGNIIGGDNENDGNGLSGVEVRGSSNQNSIGALEPLSANQIRFNHMHGVLIGSTCHLNFISQNLIAQNTQKNIMLEPGANQGIQPPVVTQTEPTLRGTAGFSSTVEIYQAHPEDLKGSSILIEAIQTGASGEFESSLSAEELGDALVLSVRDASGNASEFTPACLIEDCENPDPPDPPLPPPDPIPPLLGALVGIFCPDAKSTTNQASGDAIVVLVGVPMALRALAGRRKTKPSNRR